MSITVQEAVSQMLKIVEDLQAAYPKKKFTLGGRLIGDIGEILVEAAYDVNLFEDVRDHYDGQTSEGQAVQIKATMEGSSLSFPVRHTPDYYLGIKINKEDGSFTEVFNGPGRVIRQYAEERFKEPRNFYLIPLKALTELNKSVSPSEKIKLRSTPELQPKEE